MALNSNRRSSSSASRSSNSQSRSTSKRVRPSTSRTTSKRSINVSTRAQRPSRKQSDTRGSTRPRRSSASQLKRAPFKGQMRNALSSIALRFILIAVAIIIVLTLLWTAISSIPFLKVNTVEVSATEHLSQASLAANIQIPEGSSILTLDTDEIEKQVKKNPWVDKVTIEKKLPSTIHISVTERALGAIVVAKGGDEAWYMGLDGTWLEPIPFMISKPQEQSVNSSDTSKAPEENEKDRKEDRKEDRNAEEDQKGSKESTQASVPGLSLDSSAHAAINQTNSVSGQAAQRAKKEGITLIYDIDAGLDPKANTQVKDSGLSGALNYLENFSPNMISHINYMLAPNKSSITMMLDNGVQVALGEPGSEADIKLKETVISNLLAEHQNEVTYINVRVPNQPAWRGLKNSKA